MLDEPVSALDVSIRAQILNLLRDLQAQLGLSYLFIAHDLAAVAHMSHTIAVMYLGKIVEIGEANTVAKAPKHPYTQALFSAALPSHPDERREEIILAGEVPSPLNPPAGCRFHPPVPLAMPALCVHRACRPCSRSVGRGRQVRLSLSLPDGAVPPREGVSVITGSWSALALRGVLAIIFGFLVFLWPGITLWVLVLFFGANALIDGVLALVAAFRGSRSGGRWWAMLSRASWVSPPESSPSCGPD